ncbi:MAG: hypothetical protein CK541_02780 [Opitutia bacterium]|nr:hypothetical protein [Opitutales bacterium]PHX79887.1 MAG: hypothetical protein CK541_02780 [Opitutae bacterium]
MPRPAALLLLAVMSVGGLLAWRWLRPGDLRLSVDPRSREVAVVDSREAADRRCAGGVLRALAELTEPARREGLRTRLGELLAARPERIEIGFVPAGPAEARLPLNNPPEGGKTLPGLARAQWAALPHGYLIVHTTEVGPLLETAGRRRWLGRALVEAGRPAESATIAVGESDNGAFLVATVAFAFRTGDEAEAALKRLTERQGDFEALGFAARPGADRLTRQTKLLVIRFDIEADLVLQALGRR